MRAIITASTVAALLPEGKAFSGTYLAVVDGGKSVGQGPAGTKFAFDLAPGDHVVRIAALDADGEPMGEDALLQFWVPDHIEHAGEPVATAHAGEAASAETGTYPAPTMPHVEFA
jgi:hypothetical protein